MDFQSIVVKFADHGNAEAGFYGDDDMFLVYKLRARWRFIEKNHLELRRQLVNLIASNDKDNIALNKQLTDWNVLLDGSGFPLFSDNDLRGIDLSGLTISSGEGRVWLRGVDLSYSECHLLRVVDANLYGAKLVGVKATQLDLTNCTAHGALFQASYIPDTQFRGSDLGYCDFSNSLLSHSIFNGANCHGANFSSALLLKASFGFFADPQTGKRIYSNLSEVVWDENTRFEEVLFNEFLSEHNSKLANYIQKQRNQKTVKEELASAVELKPGVFGLSVDLPGIFKAIKCYWKNRQEKTQPSGKPDRE